MRGTSALFFLPGPAHTAPSLASLEQTYLLWLPPRASPCSRSLGASVPPTGAQGRDPCPGGLPCPDPCPAGPSPLVLRQGGFSPAGWSWARDAGLRLGAGHQRQPARSRGRGPGSPPPTWASLSCSSLGFLPLNWGDRQPHCLQSPLAQLRGCPDLQVPLPAHLCHPRPWLARPRPQEGSLPGAGPSQLPVPRAAPHSPPRPPWPPPSVLQIPMSFTQSPAHSTARQAQQRLAPQWGIGPGYHAWWGGVRPQGQWGTLSLLAVAPERRAGDSRSS